MIGVASIENLSQRHQRKRWYFWSNVLEICLILRWKESCLGFPKRTALIKILFEVWVQWRKEWQWQQNLCRGKSHGPRMDCVLIPNLLLIYLVIFYFSVCKYSLTHRAGLWWNEIQFSIYLLTFIMCQAVVHIWGCSKITFQWGSQTIKNKYVSSMDSIRW